MGQSQNNVTLSKMVLEFMWQILPLSSIEVTLTIIDLLSGFSTPEKEGSNPVGAIDLLKFNRIQEGFKNSRKKHFDPLQKALVEQIIFANNWRETT